TVGCNTGSICRESQRGQRGCIARRMQPDFHHGLLDRRFHTDASRGVCGLSYHRRASDCRGPFMTRHRTICVAAISAWCAAALFAQQPAPSFKSGTPLVAVYATVTNAQGRLVTDLERGEFSVDDNRKPQTLSLFGSDIQPITIVMLLDRSSSMKANFRLEE